MGDLQLKSSPNPTSLDDIYNKVVTNNDFSVTWKPSSSTGFLDSSVNANQSSSMSENLQAVAAPSSDSWRQKLGDFGIELLPTLASWSSNTVRRVSKVVNLDLSLAAVFEFPKVFDAYNREKERGDKHFDETIKQLTVTMTRLGVGMAAGVVGGAAVVGTIAMGAPVVVTAGVIGVSAWGSMKAVDWAGERMSSYLSQLYGES